MENDQENLLTSNKKKKKIRISSDAFPKTQEGQTEKRTPYSEVHKIIVNEGLKIERENINFREVCESDIEELKLLHGEWFPVNYEENYFEKILDKNSDNKNKHHSVVAVYKYNDRELILGSIICESKTAEEFTARVPYSYHNLSFFEDIQIFPPNYEFLYIMTIGVIDECRSMKLGSMLLERIIQMALNRRTCLAIYLHVIEHNTSAIQFYRKNGFVEIFTVKNYYRLKDEVYSGKLFCKFFTPEERLRERSVLVSLVEWLLFNPIRLLIFILTLGHLFKHLTRKKIIHS